MAGNFETEASGSKEPYSPYKGPARPANIIKARLQMTIGVVAVTYIVGRFLWQTISLWTDNNALDIQSEILNAIGVALALAAAIELAYTLFTPGPDEALYPLMLGLSAALLLQLGRAEGLDYRQAIAAVLYVGSLGILFTVRKFLSHEHEPAGWEPEGGILGEARSWLRVRVDKGARQPAGQESAHREKPPSS
jgi:hypothetical protein